MQHQRFPPALDSYRQPPAPELHYLIALRKKQRTNRDRKTATSLCSIDYKPSLSRLPPQSNRKRRVQSIPSIDIHQIEADTPKPITTMAKGSTSTKGLQYKRPRVERVKTLDPILDEKEEKIKNCIDIMKGVLQEIQVKKSSSRKGVIEEGHTQRRSFLKLKPASSKENKVSTLDHYIHRHANIQQSKPLLIKKGKSTSILNLSERRDPSKLTLHPKRTASIISLQPRQETLQPQRDKQSQKDKLQFERDKQQSWKDRQQLWKERQQSLKDESRFQLPIVLENDPKQTIDEFECSSILKVSQESFISKRDQAQLMLQLVQSHRQGEKESCERGKKTLKLSSKKIKHIFPLDFFE